MNAAMKLEPITFFLKLFISNQNYFRFYKLISCNSIYITWRGLSNDNSSLTFFLHQGTVSPETTGFPFCCLLRLAGITVEVFLPASTRGRHRISAHRTHTNIHAFSGIRTHDLSVGAGEDSPCLRPRGHCDWHTHKWRNIFRPAERLPATTSN
jgi:hypothetical protein